MLESLIHVIQIVLLILLGNAILWPVIWVLFNKKDGMDAVFGWAFSMFFGIVFAAFFVEFLL